MKALATTSAKGQRSTSKWVTTDRIGVGTGVGYWQFSRDAVVASEGHDLVKLGGSVGTYTEKNALKKDNV